jgi:hypothetical protein
MILHQILLSTSTNHFSQAVLLNRLLAAVLEHLQESLKNSPLKLLFGITLKNKRVNFPLILQQSPKSGYTNTFDWTTSAFGFIILFILLERVGLV